MDYDAPHPTARDLLSNHFVCDGHADTLAKLAAREGDFTRDQGPNHLNLPRLRSGGVNVQFAAIFIPPEVKGRNGFLQALRIALEGRRLARRGVGLVLTRKDLERCAKNSETRLLLSLEGASPLQAHLERLEILFHLGLRALGLTHNHNNEAAGGCNPPDGKRPGLSSFGRRLISAMEGLGMLLDVAHVSRKAFHQVMQCATRPVVNSHCCCAALVDIERNFTDGQLRDLAATGGLAAVTYVPRFLSSESRVTSQDVFRHLEHMVEVMGINHVGLGSDFDGVSNLPEDLGDPTRLPNLVERMQAAGWAERDIGKVLGGNWYRVLRQVLPAG